MKKAAVYVGSLPILAEVYVAETTLERMRGFMMRPLPAEPCGLFIPNCRAIHTFFMRFDIDVYFLTKNFEVKKNVRQLKPWRTAIGGVGVCSVLEIPFGVISASALQKGDILNFRFA